ncbi:MAG TPA: hypothetical protein VFG59_16480 [Anaeromyxobacter sp.]|nr:hypothetical protein [Anaeromyxobacter sp.]
MKPGLRLAFLLGVAGLAVFLYRSSPREVVLVYDLSGVAAPRSLQVTITRDGEVVRRADFPTPGAQVRHHMRLPDGRYRIDYRLLGVGGVKEGERDLTVSEAETVVLSLGR